MSAAQFPERIVCLTEEPTEVLYALGEEHRIVGISGFTVRPPRARQEKPKVSAFTSAKLEPIMALNPDLAIGFSDIQADIARELIQRGVDASPAEKAKFKQDQINQRVNQPNAVQQWLAGTARGAKVQFNTGLVLFK